MSPNFETPEVDEKEAVSAAEATRAYFEALKNASGDQSSESLQLYNDLQDQVEQGNFKNVFEFLTEAKQQKYQKLLEDSTEQEDKEHYQQMIDLVDAALTAMEKDPRFLSEMK